MNLVKFDDLWINLDQVMTAEANGDELMLTFANGKSLYFSGEAARELVQLLDAHLVRQGEVGDGG